MCWNDTDNSLPPEDGLKFLQVRRFALVMGQKNQLWWDLPAQESYRLHQQIYGIPLDQFERTLSELADLLDVGRLLSQPVRELSLGERMKMELIAAMLHSPEVLFLDEPTIGLDVIAQHLRRVLEQQIDDWSVIDGLGRGVVVGGARRGDQRQRQQQRSPTMTAATGQGQCSAHEWIGSSIGSPEPSVNTDNKALHRI